MKQNNRESYTIESEISRNQGFRQYLDFTNASDCRSVGNLRASITKITENPNCIDLLSLYVKFSSIQFNEELASCIEEFERIGVKELIIFYEAQSDEINNDTYICSKIEDFNAFLKQFKIAINLSVVPIDNKTLGKQTTPIEVSSVKHIEYQLDGRSYNISTFYYLLPDGTNLGFKSLSDSNAISIMVENYIAKRNSAIGENPFAVRRQEYITISQDHKPKRNKNITSVIGVEIDNEMAIAKDIDVEIDFDIENEVDTNVSVSTSIDSMQRKNLLSHMDAYKFLCAKLILNCRQEYFARNEGFLRGALDLPTEPLPTYLWNKPFESGTEFSKAALHFIYKRMLHEYFEQGVNPDNMPAGLVFKDNIVYVSNDPSIQRDKISPCVANPFAHSLLPLASKRYLRLSDGQFQPRTINPTTKLQDPDHFPYISVLRSILYNYVDDYYCLDLYAPYMHQYYQEVKSSDATYTQPKYDGERVLHEQYTNFDSPYQIYSKNKTYMHRNKNDSSVLMSNGERGLELREKIFDALEKRGLLEAFSSLLTNSSVQDHSFLLDAVSISLFEKLFLSMLPIEASTNKCVDPDKALFFKKIFDIVVEKKLSI